MDDNYSEAKEWKPQILVIGPAGYKSLTILGFLSTVEDKGLLNEINTYCGVSTGAVISLLMAVGYNIRDIVGESANLDLFIDFESFSVTNLDKNKKNMFAINKAIRTKLSNLVKNKLGNVPTLSGLAMETGKCFVTVSYNKTQNFSEIMTPISHPKLSCIDAVMFSMNIPFMCCQLMYGGDTLVDGMMSNPYPIDYFDDGTNQVLGVYLKYTKDSKNKNYNNSILQKIEPLAFDKNQSVYLMHIIKSEIDRKIQSSIQQTSVNCRHVKLETNVIIDPETVVTISEKSQLLIDGFNKGKYFIENFDHNEFINDFVYSASKYVYPPFFSKKLQF